MSESVLITIIGFFAAAIVGLGGILWRHMVTCSNNVAVPLAEIAIRVKQIEMFIVELRAMKHLKVDAYIPNAIDALKERVDRLENR